MARGSKLVSGELLRRYAVSGQAITIKLKPAYSERRIDASARFHVAVGYQSLVQLGYVVIDDDKGRPVEWSLAELEKYLAKYLSSTALSLKIEIDDGGGVAVGWRVDRLNKHLARVAGVDTVALTGAADARITLVSGWLQSERKISALANAQAIKKNVQLLNWMRGLGVAPPAEDIVTAPPAPAPAPEPPPPPPAPAPEPPPPAPPAPAPEPPPPPPAPAPEPPPPPPPAPAPEPPPPAPPAPAPEPPPPPPPAPAPEPPPPPPPAPAPEPPPPPPPPPPFPWGQ